MSKTSPEAEVRWCSDPPPWGRADLIAILVWSAAIAAFFWDAVSLRKALFYFDITEINYSYRDFFARELRAGRFSRWFPALYCGLPLYSESQAGYLHPLKYLLYPWLATWQAFNLDTILSIWLTGLGTFGWLRRHVGPPAALTGAAVFGLGGFVWAHLIHTSMTNALSSVAFVFWALESGWDRGRPWPLVLGAVALACQVFAGHLQDTILTSGAIGCYALYRALTERSARSRVAAVAMASGMIGLGALLSAVQWVPSKELLDRSPRAEGLSWGDLTYGSWNPELIPTLLVREAYGTRARDTDWMDGFYPYHEMNAYLGAIALALAVVGGAARRDRWVAFWVILAGVGGILMLGRFTFLFDFAHRIPIFGSARIPVRFHLWVSLAVAALAAVGVDRLSRPGHVSLRGALILLALLVAVSIPVLALVYEPVWNQPGRWTAAYHRARYHWLSVELTMAAARTALLWFAAWKVAGLALQAQSLPRRRFWAAAFPVLVIADLLGAHLADVPTVSPSYWTVPPETARRLKADRDFVRVFGIANRSAGEPGYASEPVDFFRVRDALDWSLPPVWGLDSARGETPIIPRRFNGYTSQVKIGAGRWDVEGVTHLVTGAPMDLGLGGGRRVGGAIVYRNLRALPRVRLAGLPVYAVGESDAMRALGRLGASVRDRVVVEDPDRPLAPDARPSGTARIAGDLPEHVEVETDSPSAAYLVVSDSFDPGWWATVDGKAAPIRPANVAFRAVFLTPGHHRVEFRYRPSGFSLGLAVTLVGAVLALGLVLVPSPAVHLEPEHGATPWTRPWLSWGAWALCAIVLVSALKVDRAGHLAIHPRWVGNLHRFTWGAGLEAMRPTRGRGEEIAPLQTPIP